jgi:GDP-L-fucose synthase
VCPTARLQFDTSKPDGTPRKALDVSRLADTGWSSSIDLDTGIRSTYEWFLDQQRDCANIRGIAGVPAIAG